MTIPLDLIELIHQRMIRKYFALHINDQLIRLALQCRQIRIASYFNDSINKLMLNIRNIEIDELNAYLHTNNVNPGILRALFLLDL